MKQFSKEWVKKAELSKEWASFIINPNARPGKNSTLYRTHRSYIPARLLTARRNTVTANLTLYFEKHCAKLTENIPSKTNGLYT